MNSAMKPQREASYFSPLFENDPRFQMSDLKYCLHKQGLKFTKQREAVWSALQMLRHRHPSCEDIYLQSRELSPNIGWATVYRTLRWLKEAGLIQERNFGGGRVRYEPRFSKEKQVHLICRRCGKIIELAAPEMGPFWKSVAQKHNFSIDLDRVEGYGLCPSCEHKNGLRKADGRG
jgi:Fur family transcriptional regulator, ferric uptake regulator